jgi:hypothetical protein
MSAFCLKYIFPSRVKLVLFVDEDGDYMLSSVGYWLEISLNVFGNPSISELCEAVKRQKPGLQFNATAAVSEFADMVRNADYAVMDGGVLRGKGDEFLDRTPDMLKRIIRGNPNTKFIISGGLPIEFYEDWLEGNRDLVNLAYIDINMMSHAIGSLIDGDSAPIKRYFSNMHIKKRGGQ